MENYSTTVATFVMPHWRNENYFSKAYLDKAIESIEKQSDTNWHLVIIDDCSPCQEVIDYLECIKQRLKDKVTIFKLEKNSGAGVARNKGIEWAHQHHSDIVLFLDADDICDYRRLEVVRSHFVNNRNAIVVYSSFELIDEYGASVPEDKIPAAIKEILDGHMENVVEGENAWIKIATEKNYTNLTSATAVKTSIAYNNMFPSVRVSEDTHTWLRYGANKGEFVFDNTIPSLYRIPLQANVISASRDRIDDFCEQKVIVDTDGFVKAMEIAKKNGFMSEIDENELYVRFWVKLAESMYYAGSEKLKNELIARATGLNCCLTAKLIRDKGIL